jgi:hypothetical protein
LDKLRRIPAVAPSALAGAAAGLLLAAGLHAGYVALWHNFFTVIPGRVYRCAQPPASDLERLIRAYGIGTVFNLRGRQPDLWYQEECAAARRGNAVVEDLCLRASRLPPAGDLAAVVAVLDGARYPILIHCASGADRTGLVSAVAILLQPDGTLEKARRQLGVRYNHVPAWSGASMDEVLDLYAEWLAAAGRQHTPQAFRQWALRAYCPGEYRCTLELLDAPALVAPAEPFALHVRAHNTSARAWQFREAKTVGVHAAFALFDGRDPHPLDQGRSGFFDARVDPGQSVDLTVPVPGIRFGPGLYVVQVDLVKEGGDWFSWMGSTPLYVPVCVGP